MNKTKKSSINKKKKTNKILKTKKKPMEIEFEVKFLEINKSELVDKIKSFGGKLKQGLTLYKRSVFGLCDVKKGYVRVRDEGDKITMTAKLYKDPKFPEEYEFELKDNNTFENGEEFLSALNLNKKAYHETMREKWTIPKPNGKELCELAIDYIPGLPVYVEVECKSKADLNKSIKMLGLPKNKMMFGAYGQVFVHYYDMTRAEIDDNVSSLTFKNIEKELEKYVRKNKDLLHDVARTHLEVYNKLKAKI